MTTIVHPRNQRTSTLPVVTSQVDPALLADARDLSESLSEVIRVVQFRDRDRACCYDVSVSQCYALKGVVDAGALTINDLAAYLYLDKSTASRIANGLVDKGLVARRRDPDDGRSVRLVPTLAGRDVCARIEDDLTAEYAQLLDGFEPEFRSAILKLVDRIRRSFASRVEAAGGSCCVVE